MKSGKAVEVKYLKSDSPLFKEPLSEKYWRYIIGHLVSQGLIEGVTADASIDNAGTLIYGLENAVITPEGIAYLNENSMFEKVKKVLKDTKESIPFI